MDNQNQISLRIQKLQECGYSSERNEDFSGAESFYHQALKMARKYGDQDGMGNSLHYLGAMMFDLKKYEKARIYLDEALDLKLNIGDVPAIADLLCNLGHVNETEDNIASAFSYFFNAFIVYRYLGQSENRRISITNDKLINLQSKLGDDWLNQIEKDIDDVYSKIYLKLEKVIKLSDDFRLPLSNWLAHIIANVGNQQQVGRSEKLLHDLYQVSAFKINLPEIQNEVARGLRNAIVIQGRYGTLEKAEEHFNKLRIIAKNAVDNMEMQKQYGDSIVSMMHYYQTAMHPDLPNLMEELFVDLRGIVKCFPKSAYFKDILADGEEKVKTTRFLKKKAKNLIKKALKSPDAFLKLTENLLFNPIRIKPLLQFIGREIKKETKIKRKEKLQALKESIELTLMEAFNVTRVEQLLKITSVSKKSERNTQDFPLQIRISKDTEQQQEDKPKQPDSIFENDKVHQANRSNISEKPSYRIEQDYEIIETREGGMGIVYICKSKESGNFVALKTYKDKYFVDYSIIELFIREAENWIKIEPHPNVVRAFNLYEYNKKPFIILEYIPGNPKLGTSLKEVVSKKRLSYEEIIGYAIQICLGMVHIDNVFHKQKKVAVHRDLKPENILIHTDGWAKITDFGLMHVQSRIAKMLNLGKEASSVGTPGFMSPEQKRSEIIDQRSDVYSFGKILFFMVTGQIVIDDTGIEIEKIPTDLQGLVSKCLELNKKNRYASFTAILNDLSDILGVKDLMNRLLTEIKKVTDIDEIEQLKRDAQTAFILKKYKEAISFYNRLIDKNIEKDKMLLNLAISYGKIGDSSNNKKYTLEALRLNPNLALAWYNLGLIHADKREFEKELEYYDKALAIDPDFIECWINRASVCMNLQRNEEAEANIIKALELDSNQEHALFIRSLLNIRLGKEDEVEETLQKIIKSDPSFSFINKFHGSTLFRQMGITSSADFYKFLESKGLGSIRKLLSTIGLSSEVNEQQIELKKRIDKEYNEKTILQEQAQLAMDMEDFVTAIKILDKAIALDPDDAETLSMLGAAHMMNDDNLVLAETYFKRSLKINPRFSQTLTNYAWCLGRLGRVEEAEKIGKKALEVNPNKENNWSIMADVYLHLGKFDESRKCLKKMIEINPNSDAHQKLIFLDQLEKEGK